MRTTAEADDRPVAVDASSFGIAISGDLDGPVVVRVAGERDTSTSPQLEGVLTDLIDGRADGVVTATHDISVAHEFRVVTAEDADGACA